jgi:hypothetical protein
MINFEQEYLIHQSQPKHNLSLVKSDHHFSSLGNSTITTSCTTMTSEYLYFPTSAITISSYQKLDCTSMEWSIPQYRRIFMKQEEVSLLELHKWHDLFGIVHSKRKNSEI